VQLFSANSQLRRPAAQFPEWRLDRLLRRKAEEGVRIYIQVYKEVRIEQLDLDVTIARMLMQLQVDVSMSLASKHTKVLS
jgi:phospholipase D1/2